MSTLKEGSPRSRRAIRLKTRLIVVTVVPVAALIAAITTLASSLAISRAQESAIASTSSLVEALSQDFQKVHLLGDQSVASDLVVRLRPFDSVIRLWLLDETGSVNFAYAAQGMVPAPPPVADEGVSLGNDTMTLVRPLALTPATQGRIIVECSTRQLQQQVRQIIQMGAAMTAAAVLLVGSLIWLAATRVLRPVGELTRAARSLAQGSWDQRVDESRGDELGVLAAAFNSMVHELERSYRTVEQRVQQRTEELQQSNASLLENISLRQQSEAEREKLNQRLLTASRQAGMAEVATGVLHNVGNALNSVNVSAGLISNWIQQSNVSGLSKAVRMIRDHDADLGTFLTSDDKGRKLPEYLARVSALLTEEQQAMLEELTNVIEGVDHIRQIICMQQSHAKTVAVVEPVRPADLFEAAVKVNLDSLARHHVKIVREFEELPLLGLDKHRVLQILFNLVSNAKQAVKSASREHKQITLRITLLREPTGPRLRMQVADNGIGIAPENLTRVFGHGFTTREDGHGFGLHSSANAATELGGSLTAGSAGLGQGATFTLEIPLPVTRAQPEVIRS